MRDRALDRSTRLLVLAGVLAASVLTVYTQYVFLHTTDHVTNRPFRELSLEQYRQTLDGERRFPYQWRVAGPWLVRLGESATGLDPHQVDVAIKVAALALSALFMMRLAALWVGPVGTLAAAAMYFVLTAGAYSSEGYSIYYTNDFLVVLGWNAAVYFAATSQWGRVAVVVFLTAWAKETVVLVPALAALAWRNGRAGTRDVLLTAAAALVPTLLLRAYYVAPLTEWAWWDNVARNVPFLRLERDALAVALTANLKLLVFFNVWGLLAWRAFRRTAVPVLRDLVYVGLVYLAIMYLVVYIRELRQFLPLLTIVLPLAMLEIERLVDRTQRHRDSRSQSAAPA